MSTYTIVTHSRSFHIDELMAIALLNKFVLKGDYDLIRTRDKNVVSMHQKNENSFVIDVGFVHDENNLNFDHHQGNFDEKWDNGLLLSSCGLIWNFLKTQGILSKELSDDLISHIEKEVIMKVDSHDNGVEVFKDAIFSVMYNKNIQEDDKIDIQFKKALVVLSDYLENTIFEYENKSEGMISVDFLFASILLNNYRLKHNEKINSMKDFVNYAKNIEITRSWNKDQKFGILGQVWYDLWKDNKITNKNMNEDLKTELEVHLIQKLDQGNFSEFKYLMKYNRMNGSLDKKALMAASQHFYNVLSSIKNKMNDFKELQKDVIKSKDLKGIVMLSANHSEMTTNILKLCDKDLCIVPHSKNKWIIKSVPKTQTDLFSTKCPMPSKWLGLSSEELTKISGFSGLEFVHKNAFMCVFYGTIEEVKLVANEVLKFNNYDFKKKNKVMTKEHHKHGKKEKGVNHNAILDIQVCVDSSKEYENLVVLDKNYDEVTINELLKTGKRFFMKPKGDSRWIISTINKEAFIDSAWKKLHGDNLFNVSGVKELCSCDKKLNSCVVKTDMLTAINIVNTVWSTEK
jgi:uncharacterized UPF0160 family protein